MYVLRTDEEEDGVKTELLYQKREDGWYCVWDDDDPLPMPPFLIDNHIFVPRLEQALKMGHHFSPAGSETYMERQQTLTRIPEEEAIVRMFEGA